MSHELESRPPGSPGPGSPGPGSHAIDGRPLVLFDLDGTLVDSSPGIASSLRAATRRAGVTEPTDDQVRQLIGPPFPGAFVDVLGVDERTAATMMSAYHDVYGSTGLYEVTVYPGVGELLAALGDAGIARGVTTSKPDVYARAVLTHVGLADMFDAGIHGARLDGSVEGKAAVISLALAAHPGRAACVLVGDRHHDVEGAHHHGLRVVGVTWGFGGREELVHAGADVVVDTIEDLAHALTDPSS